MSEATTIGQRFTRLIQQLGITKNAFAQSIGRTATVVQHLVDERNYPGYELLCKVVEVYPNVSLDWLMLGKGPMLLPGHPAELAASAPPEADPSAMEPIDLASLTPPARRRNGTHLQPADIAATLTLATKPPQPALAVPTAAPVAAAAPVPVPAMAGAAAEVPAAARPAPPTSPAATPAAEPLGPAAPAEPAAPTGAEKTLAATLHTQHLQHQLALAEQRNQHLLEKQVLLKQMLELLQKSL